MKKYQMGGTSQSYTSDELNPNKIKSPVAPNPSFVPSGSGSQMKKGGSVKSKKC
jgi:hypothetical protein